VTEVLVAVSVIEERAGRAIELQTPVELRACLFVLALFGESATLFEQLRALGVGRRGCGQRNHKRCDEHSYHAAIVTQVR
jgi:hypothetical protein